MLPDSANQALKSIGIEQTKVLRGWNVVALRSSRHMVLNARRVRSEAETKSAHTSLSRMRCSSDRSRSVACRRLCTHSCDGRMRLSSSPADLVRLEGSCSALQGRTHRVLRARHIRQRAVLHRSGRTSPLRVLPPSYCPLLTTDSALASRLPIVDEALPAPPCRPSESTSYR